MMNGHRSSQAQLADANDALLKQVNDNVSLTMERQYLMQVERQIAAMTAENEHRPLSGADQAIFSSLLNERVEIKNRIDKLSR